MILKKIIGVGTFLASALLGGCRTQSAYYKSYIPNEKQIRTVHEDLGTVIDKEENKKHNLGFGSDMEEIVFAEAEDSMYEYVCRLTGNRIICGKIDKYKYDDICSKIKRNIDGYAKKPAVQRNHDYDLFGDYFDDYWTRGFVGDELDPFFRLKIGKETMSGDRFALMTDRFELELPNDVEVSSIINLENSNLYVPDETSTEWGTENEQVRCFIAFRDRWSCPYLFGIGFVAEDFLLKYEGPVDTGLTARHCMVPAVYYSVRDDDFRFDLTAAYGTGDATGFVSTVAQTTEYEKYLIGLKFEVCDLYDETIAYSGIVLNLESEKSAMDIADRESIQVCAYIGMRRIGGMLDLRYELGQRKINTQNYSINIPLGDISASVNIGRNLKFKFGNRSYLEAEQENWTPGYEGTYFNMELAF